jgi:hypothetical protein
MRFPYSLSATTSSILSLFAFSISLVAFVLAVAISRHREINQLSHPNQSSLSQKDELNDCVAKTLKTAKPDVLGISFYVSLYEQVSQFCGRQIVGLDQLNEFNMRLAGFSRQRLDDPIILWMVVAITISGVGLAALQLIASYRLASGGRGELGTANEFSVERDKLTFKSSVTGLVILVVSLAFFIVYVKWVYPITEVKFEVPPSEPSSTSPQAYGSGQIGIGAQWNQPSVKGDTVTSGDHLPPATLAQSPTSRATPRP